MSVGADEQTLATIADALPLAAIDPFCTACGSPVAAKCSTCGTLIRGAMIMNFGLPDRTFTRPRAYCHSCGTAFPWTAATLAAVRELAEADDNLTDDDRTQLVGAVESLIVEEPSPETTVAENRLRRITAKMAGMAGQAVYKVAVDVMSASVRKDLGL